jgi:hypothetical protein
MAGMVVVSSVESADVANALVFADRLYEPLGRHVDTKVDYFKSRRFQSIMATKFFS